MSAAAGQPETHSSPRPAPPSPRASGNTTGVARSRSAAVGFDVNTADPGVLFLRWKQFDDEGARGALVERFLPLARSLARRYAHSGVPLEDLIQVASFGLVKAIDRFDPARGPAFSSFAIPTILGELKRHFRDCGWAVHVPRGAQEHARKVELAERQLAGQTGRSPTVGELARYLGVGEEEILDGLETAQAYAAVSLDAPRATVDDAQERCLDVIGADDHELALVDASVTVGTALEQLPRRDRVILHLRFVEDLTQTEIAKRIGISQMQVSRLLRRSLQRLRELTEDAESCERLERFG
jgi:RNA polymerase sigma-B factor